MMGRRQVICVFEDRKSCEQALKLLLIGLSRHNARTPVVVFYRPADQEFLDWVQTLDFENSVVRTNRLRGAYGWNVKPHAMLELLTEDNYEILWIELGRVSHKQRFCRNRRAWGHYTGSH